MLMIQIINDDTGDEKEENYDCEVYLNRQLLWTGRIEKHNRMEGWEGLLQKLNDVVQKDKLDRYLKLIEELNK